MIADSNKFTIINVLFTPEQKMRHKEILGALSPQHRLLKGHGISRANENGIKLMFSGIILIFQSKIKKVQHSLETLVTLLDRVGIRSEVGCNDCGGHNHLECYKVGHGPLVFIATNVWKRSRWSSRMVLVMAINERR